MKTHYSDIKKIEDRLTQYNAKLTEIRRNAAAVQGDTKLEYHSQMRRLEKFRDALENKLVQICVASENVF